MAAKEIGYNDSSRTGIESMTATSTPSIVLANSMILPFSDRGLFRTTTISLILTSFSTTSIRPNSFSATSHDTILFPLGPHLSRPHTDREDIEPRPPESYFNKTMQTNSDSPTRQHTKSSSCSEIDIKSLEISSGSSSKNTKKEEVVHVVENKSTESLSSVRSEHSISNPQQGSKMAIKSYAEMARGVVVEPPVQQPQQPQVQVQQTVATDAKGVSAGHDDKAPDVPLPPPATRENNNINPAPISAPADFSAGTMPLHPQFHAHQQNHTPFSAEAWEQRKKTMVPPNKRDTRKLFVGGLPTDGELHLGFGICVYIFISLLRGII